MSDSESVNLPTQHATLGGKSLAALERPRYKSWRKKYRKMKHRFDGVLEDNKRFFKEEQKLEGIAKRLREELDSLLEICLDLNQSPALPPHLRFNIERPGEAHTTVAKLQKGLLEREIPADISLADSSAALTLYGQRVEQQLMPQDDLYIVHQRVERVLAARDTITLNELEEGVSHPIVGSASELLREDLRGDEPPSFFTTDHEELHLLRTDANLTDPLAKVASLKHQKHEASGALIQQKHWADLSARELERHVELHNPQSQHNWLKTHAKHGGAAALDIDDNESFVSHESKPTRGGGKRNLAKQVGDRSVNRAREKDSPGANSAWTGEDDELPIMEETPSTTKKRRRAADEDSTYRSKAGSSKQAGGSGSKSKRKRSGEDIVVAKKAKMEALE